jgi:hypothetical protein
VAELLRRGALRQELGDYDPAGVRRQQTYGASRVDFVLPHPDGSLTLLEVKNVVRACASTRSRLGVRVFLCSCARAYESGRVSASVRLCACVRACGVRVRRVRAGVFLRELQLHVSMFQCTSNSITVTL